jgi:hypothetical protein
MTTASPPTDLPRHAARIGPAAYSARAHEQYPYRPRPGHETEDVPLIRAEADVILRGVDRMIWQQLHRRLPRAQRHDLEDAYQHVALRLWVYVLPRFDAFRGCKLTTLLYASIARLIGEVVKSHTRQAIRAERHRHEALVGQDVIDPAPPHYLDARVEQIAQHIIQEPERYLGQAAAKAIKATRSSDQSRTEVAHLVGYERLSSLSEAMRRARVTVAQIDIENFQPFARSYRRPRDAAAFQRTLGITMAEAMVRRRQIERVISGRQIEVFRAVLRQPIAELVTVGRPLGLTSGAMHETLVSIRDRIMELDSRRKVPARRTRPPSSLRPLIDKLGIDPAILSFDLTRRIVARLSRRERELFEAALNNRGLTTAALARQWGVVSPSVSITLRRLRRKIIEVIGHDQCSP